MKVCDSCQKDCKGDHKCNYVKLEKGEIKIKCYTCNDRVNQWCHRYDKQFNLVMFKCIEEAK